LASRSLEKRILPAAACQLFACWGYCFREGGLPFRAFCVDQRAQLDEAFSTSMPSDWFWFCGCPTLSGSKGSGFSFALPPVDLKPAPFEMRKWCGTPTLANFCGKTMSSSHDFIDWNLKKGPRVAGSHKKPSGQPGLSGTGRFRFGGVRLRAYRCGAGALSLATAFVSAVVGYMGMFELLLALTSRVR